MVYVKMVNFLKKRQMKGVSYLKNTLLWVSVCVQSTIFYVA